MPKVNDGVLALLGLAAKESPAFRELSEVYVPGEGGNPTALIIGEAPGAQEELHRRPFVGPAGQVLRQLMGLAGLHTINSVGPNCWVTNVVKFRPPRNRKPYWVEVRKARPFLRAEWEAVGKPRVIIPVGGTALQAVTGRPNISILKHSGWMHAEVSRVDGDPLYVWPMIHPSAGLREPSLRGLMEKDWEKLAEWLRTDFPRLESVLNAANS